MTDAEFAKLSDDVKEAWGDLCEADGMPRNTSFLMYNEDNPHFYRYEALLEGFMDEVNRRSNT